MVIGPKCCTELVQCRQHDNMSWQFVPVNDLFMFTTFLIIGADLHLYSVCIYKSKQVWFSENMCPHPSTAHNILHTSSIWPIVDLFSFAMTLKITKRSQKPEKKSSLCSNVISMQILSPIHQLFKEIFWLYGDFLCNFGKGP